MARLCQCCIRARVAVKGKHDETRTVACANAAMFAVAPGVMFCSMHYRHHAGKTVQAVVDPKDGQARGTTCLVTVPPRKERACP